MDSGLLNPSLSFLRHFPLHPEDDSHNLYDYHKVDVKIMIRADPDFGSSSP